jgi:hypothetical protein
MSLSFPFHHGVRIVEDVIRAAPPEPEPETETVYVRYYSYTLPGYSYFTMTGSLASGLFTGNGCTIQWSPEGYPDEWIFTDADMSVGRFDTSPPQENTYFDDIFIGGLWDAYCRFYPHDEP